MLVGIDEVGRGSWAGPVVAAAVILRPKFYLPKKATWKLNDSKLLTKGQREIADLKIRKLAIAIGIGWVEPKEVDSLGLTQAVRLSMERALEQIIVDYDEIIIDGNYNFFPGNPKCRAMVKADATVPTVSAASIVAKVARDKFMSEASLKYPNYGFDKHVGYGTALHLSKLREFGVSEIHRLSYKPVQALVPLAS